jgi:hypothetical protein
VAWKTATAPCLRRFEGSDSWTLDANVATEGRWPADAHNIVTPAKHDFGDSMLDRRGVEVSGGLGGKRIESTGLQATTDVLVRAQRATGGRRRRCAPVAAVNRDCAA